MYFQGFFLTMKNYYENCNFSYSDSCEKDNLIFKNCSERAPTGARLLSCLTVGAHEMWGNF